MSATERLRALLTERGVEWRGGLPTETMVEADGLDLLYVALPDGRVRAFIRNYLTPEQAIAATLGNEGVGRSNDGVAEPEAGTCHVKAAQKLGDLFGFSLSCGHSMVNPLNDRPDYCPWCGRKVVTNG